MCFCRSPHIVRLQIVIGYALGILGYVLGLMASTAMDLPSGPAVVWIMTALSIVFAFAVGRGAAAHRTITMSAGDRVSCARTPA